MYTGYITDVEGIKLGHCQDEEAITGCTVIICEEGASGGVDVRGSAPGTRETDLFKAEKMVDRVHGIVLSGGSAFGLDASTGVMKYLEENNIGLDVGITKVPIVSSAVIFDLNIGDGFVRPDAEMGYRAAESANNVERLQGNVGAGMGATVGKILGPDKAMKSGLGSASVKSGELVVAAMVVLNSFGDIYDFETNKQMAGVYDYEKEELLNTIDIIKEKNLELGFNPSNTTIAVVATNAKLDKSQCNKLAQVAHNGFARSINPVHTMVDGDTIFSMATNRVEGDINLIGILGEEAISKAISNALFASESLAGLKSYKEIKR